MKTLKEIIASIKLFREKEVLTAVLALLGVFIIYYLIFSPALKQYSSLSNEIKDRNLDLSRVKTPSGEYQILEKEINDLKGQVDSLKNRFFWEKDISRFLNEITRLAADTEIEFVALKPESALPPTEQQKAEFEKYKFSRVPISVSLKSSYHDLVVFFKRIEEADKLIQIDALSINHESRNIYKHSVSLKFSIFTKEDAT